MNFLHVSDKTKKIKTVKATDTIAIALQILSKSPSDFIVLVDNDNSVLGIFDKDILIKELVNVSFKQSTKLNKIKCISDKKMFNIIQETELLSNIDVKKYTVVVNSKGKYKGILIV
jgi:predicted transcriptional regulator